MRSLLDLHNGQLTCTNLFGWELFYPFHTTGHGSSNEPHYFWDWKGKCAKCSQPVQAMEEGIFCANFGHSILGFPKCHQVWHAKCYECLGKKTGIDFPIKEMEDEQGNPWYKQAEREDRINYGIAGAHVVMPFQCECCWMKVLEGRAPRVGDELLVACIRRVNLDAMTGQSKDTIKQHVNRMRRVLNFSKKYGKTPSFVPRGPLPPEDRVGMGTGLDMIIYSLEAEGRNDPYVQFSTLRQVRSSATKNYDSSPQGVMEGTCFARGTSKVRISECPTQSEFFGVFLNGLEYRMGVTSKANLPVSIRVIVELLKRVKSDAAGMEVKAEADQLHKFGAFVAVCTAGSLRGCEGFLTDLSGLISNLSRGRNGVIPAKLKDDFDEDVAERLPHVVITLLGRVKSETNEDTHQLAVASTTSSGVEVRWWIEKLVEICRSEGRRSGPAFATPSGKLASSTEFNAMLHKYLEEIQAQTTLIEDKLVVRESFGISRTFRKTAEARATRAGVPAKVQDKMNRWRSVENADGKKPRFVMRDLYAGVLAQMPVTWRYSYAL